MNDEKTGGTISDIKGKAKEGAGKLTGNEQQEAEGKAQQVQGDAQKRLGDAQDKIRDDDRR
jgi:uncharacterized protein YjbJ (UPF0337 family)